MQKNVTVVFTDCKRATMRASLELWHRLQDRFQFGLKVREEFIVFAAQQAGNLSTFSH